MKLAALRNVSVIVCTYNRCRSLAVALESLVRQNPPPAGDWEIVVVDNNSTDHTRETVLDFSRRYTVRLRYLFEARSGKSFALNSGIKIARGDVLAFTDDDVTFEPTWLHNLTAVFRDEQWSGSAGRIIPVWPCEPPDWLPANSQVGRGSLVSFDLGVDPGPLTEAPFGANMAIRKSIFEKHGGFRTDLVPVMYGWIRGEDTELAIRLLNAGERLYYEPSAVVYHPVTAERLERRYHLGWWYGKGRSEIRTRGIRRAGSRHVAGVPLRLIRSIAVWTLRWAITFRKDLRFERKVAVWSKAGSIVECYRLWQRRDKHS